MHKKIKILDCTLRDGGYYNNWDFDLDLVESYLKSMDALNIDYIEIGLRSLINNKFKGGFAYSTDNFIRSLKIPKGLQNKIGVMVNGSEIANKVSQVDSLKKLFKVKSESPVSLVRVACHFDQFADCLPCSIWLKEKGYKVGFNIMQIADRSDEEIEEIAKKASNYPIDVLYFADSMGGLNPEDVVRIITIIKKQWKNEIGVHTHDNKGKAVANSRSAVESGSTWVDGTVCGMGRGPGNAQTEFLILELAEYWNNESNSIKLFELINKYFKPLKYQFDWGKNPFYFLSGQYGIHPTFVQEMLRDKRYNEKDILAVINHLKINGGKKFSLETLESARNFFSERPEGNWNPENLLKNKEVLILGTGPGTKKYKSGIENFIKQKKCFVIALNIQSEIDENLVDARSACHPIRILADYKDYLDFNQPIITPSSYPSNPAK
jgi:4-hydroxy 2-oxovalerate aldolase